MLLGDLWATLTLSGAIARHAEGTAWLLPELNQAHSLTFHRGCCPFTRTSPLGPMMRDMESGRRATGVARWAVLVTTCWGCQAELEQLAVDALHISDYSAEECAPTDCEAAGAQCGGISDGCSGALDCGICPGVGICGGQGDPNRCPELDDAYRLSNSMLLAASGER